MSKHAFWPQGAGSPGSDRASPYLETACIVSGSISPKSLYEKRFANLHGRLDGELPLGG
jgi:hypothetical protein